MWIENGDKVINLDKVSFIEKYGGCDIMVHGVSEGFPIKISFESRNARDGMFTRLKGEIISRSSLIAED